MWAGEQGRNKKKKKEEKNKEKIKKKRQKGNNGSIKKLIIRNNEAGGQGPSINENQKAKKSTQSKDKQVMHKNKLIINTEMINNTSIK